MDLLRVSTTMHYLAVVIGLMHIVQLPDLNNYVDSINGQRAIFPSVYF